MAKEIDVAILANEIQHMKKQREEDVKRIEELEAHKKKTERYGFIAMGVLAMGAAIVAGIDKVASKLLSLAH